MTGEIIKIHEKKMSRNGNVFIRVEFKMSDGSWAKTDLCPDYRNFNRWKGLGLVGQILDNLTMKSDKEVDADSSPVKINNF